MLLTEQGNGILGFEYHTQYFSLKINKCTVPIALQSFACECKIFSVAYQINVSLGMMLKEKYISNNDRNFIKTMYYLCISAH